MAAVSSLKLPDVIIRLDKLNHPLWTARNKRRLIQTIQSNGDRICLIVERLLEKFTSSVEWTAYFKGRIVQKHFDAIVQHPEYAEDLSLAVERIAHLQHCVADSWVEKTNLILDAVCQNPRHTRPLVGGLVRLMSLEDVVKDLRDLPCMSFPSLRALIQYPHRAATLAIEIQSACSLVYDKVKTMGERDKRGYCGAANYECPALFLAQAYLMEKSPALLELPRIKQAIIDNPEQALITAIEESRYENAKHYAAAKQKMNEVLGMALQQDARGIVEMYLGAPQPQMPILSFPDVVHIVKEAEEKKAKRLLAQSAAAVEKTSLS